MPEYLALSALSPGDRAAREDVVDLLEEGGFRPTHEEESLRRDLASDRILSYVHTADEMTVEFEMLHDDPRFSIALSPSRAWSEPSIVLLVDDRDRPVELARAVVDLAGVVTRDNYRVHVAELARAFPEIYVDLGEDGMAKLELDELPPP